ncbi:MAG: NADH-quinone oxidoreductase subunit NuoK [Syntrophotalea acetylenica]|jgi:NADH-quinone oxidoreductase subunit K|uniref:NADH-quinone oxidoreductase subunit K n=1 Tax=Syntrophotalea acetylenica TaxID=29542 RepID=A0A1L3GF46_SYNAC|nr:NADH-quinone oxidoreductase subunit NuoK [Syntrophotalea acetylenica]APG24586.1 NADH-quinone oxidoreductase subunit K [Syntrophotalea acetylenica]APG45168.1 NADH-quinone oxidoreductase subunit K [Syntrophotalea acetylenica]MDD4457494.1 NADH-quinone oxidoreductase subunit NuoK [Syntrophotalea acetylenica]
MMVPLGHVVTLAGLLFTAGLLGVLLRRNLIMILIGVEIMLNAAGIVLVGASAYWRHPAGQLFALLLMAVAAAEVTVALALVIYLKRSRGTLDVNRFDGMKG